MAEATPAQRTMFALFRLVGSARLDLSSEARAQAGLEEALTLAGVEFSREHRLGPADRPDFFVPVDLDGRGVVVELKAHRISRRATLRQLERYAKYPEVGGIILAAATAFVLPREIAGKPAAFVSLGRAWL